MALAGAAGVAGAWPVLATEKPGSGPEQAWRRLEQGVQGRLGVAVLDTASGATWGQRADERFPMCSTFKWLAASLVLSRVDAGQEQLSRLVRYSRDQLVPYSPATEKQVATGMTVGALCEAAVTLSDNTAGNLLLAASGGPEALTAHARTLGDLQTRLDRVEPALNEGTPGDPRDTTTPAAMVAALRSAALGTALRPASREQLVRWLRGTQTGVHRLRAGLPAGWTLGSKTGTGERGSTNEVALVWPPGRAPLVVAVYLTETQAPLPRREAILASVARGLPGLRAVG
jgi:beta-lactamase class A